MPATVHETPLDPVEDTAPAVAEDARLTRIEDRVRWLATAIVEHANHVRVTPSGLKVGGHQASSASMTTIMTHLWFAQLRAQDRVSVKPHASPVLHAIEYLLGQLDERWLTTLREFGGLQSYPSRHKDPVPADYSTGSVGIGATAPIWGALARRYVDTHLAPVGRGRQYSLLGDAELDEGACWEAVLDPLVTDLGEVVWIVDLNRQSLDRVVPNIGAPRLVGMFAAAGWQVITVKYGSRLERLFACPGGGALRARIDKMSNVEYQRLVRCNPAQLRARLTDAQLADFLTGVDDAELHAAFRNLGGHDHAALRAAFAQIDDTRPTVIFAYTIKGYGLATEGHPQNHSSLLTTAQLHELAARSGVDPADPWRRFAPGSPEQLLCKRVAADLERAALPAAAPLDVPRDLGRTPNGIHNTQAALGRTLLEVAREAPEVGRRIVTVSPDVSSSTNLGGWVNKVAVWSHADLPDLFADDGETILHWREHTGGQHIEHEPGGRPWRARHHVEPVEPAAAAGGRCLRPVRAARARAVVVRDLRRRPVDPGGDTLGRDPRAGGRRAPVDQHAVRRGRAAGLRLLRAGLRAGHRMGAAGMPVPARATGRLVGVRAALDPSGGPVARGSAE